MKAILGAAAAAGLLIAAAQARGDADSHAGLSEPAAAAAAARVGWGDLARSFGLSASPAEPAPVAVPEALAGEIDVVDAHWMALTMWGEARGEGEEAMRAVGHVIDNRRKAGGRHGPFVTDTVSEAWQFSCWNPGDPNRAAIRRVDSLPPGSREEAAWRAARRIAEEILAGRSPDPTGGALFYHAETVSPTWSRGLEPVRRIGGHLFFRSARRG